MQYRPALGVASAIVLAAVVASCVDTTAPVHLPEGPSASLTALPRLLECPLASGWAGRITIGPDGGSWGHQGVRISIPPDAVPEQTTFAVSIPASRYAEIRVTADGHRGYRFRKPVTIEIPYDRCSLGAALDGDLRVWYIDSDSRALLEFMGGTNDRSRRAVRFQTDHLSGYAIAN